jgi:hypothetical protein
LTAKWRAQRARSQPPAGLRVVEHHPRVIAVEQFVEAVEVAIGILVQIHHHHFGAGTVQHFTIEGSQGALVHDACAAFAKRFAQLASQLIIVKQKRDCGSRFSH